MTFKQRAHQLIDSLPEEPTTQEVEEAFHELIDNLKIEKGRKDLSEGRSFTNDEVKRRTLDGFPFQVGWAEDSHARERYGR